MNENVCIKYILPIKPIVYSEYDMFSAPHFLVITSNVFFDYAAFLKTCVYTYIHIYFFIYIYIYIYFLPLVLLGECVISLVLSHHKNLKRWTSITALRQAIITALGQTRVRPVQTDQVWSSDLLLFYFHGLSFPCLLATAILDSLFPILPT